MLFYTQNQPVVSVVEEALKRERLDDAQAKAQAKSLVTSGLTKPLWFRIGVSIVILTGLLLLAANISNEKISETMLDCFKVMFAAFIGVLGFETSKKDG